MKTKLWTMPSVLALIVSPIVAAAPPTSQTTTTDDGRVLSSYAENFYVADPVPSASSSVPTSPDRDWTCLVAEAARYALTAPNKSGAATNDVSEESSEPASPIDPAAGCPLKSCPKCPSDTAPTTVIRNLEKIERAHQLAEMAAACAASGRMTEAHRYYRQVIQLVPGSRLADDARSRTTTPMSRITTPAEGGAVAGAEQRTTVTTSPTSRGTQSESRYTPYTGEETAEPPIAVPYSDWSLPILILEPIHFVPNEDTIPSWNEVRSFLHNWTGFEFDNRGGKIRVMFHRNIAR